jgi:hypothetical protein
MKYFQQLEMIIPPKSRTKVIFQCDENFFNNYGIYTLLSCNRHRHDVHLHLINSNDKLISRIKDLNLSIDLSISSEVLDIENVNFYRLKSYYFCARYFICNYLFENNLIDLAYVTDADIIFNDTIVFNTNVTLGVLYFPQYDTLWKQTGANLLYVTNKRKDFVSKIIELYNKKFNDTDFESITPDMDKFVISNMNGLDQVCMSTIIKDETDFLNLALIDDLISKQQTSRIWSLTGPWKKEPNIKDILENYVNT